MMHRADTFKVTSPQSWIFSTIPGRRNKDTRSLEADRVGFQALPIGNCVIFDNLLELLGLFFLICEKEENDTVFQKQPPKDGLGSIV